MKNLYVSVILTFSVFLSSSQIHKFSIMDDVNGQTFVVDGKPASTMRTDSNFNIIRKVVQNPINENVHGSTARPVGSIGGNNHLILVADVNRENEFDAEFEGNTRDSYMRGFHTTGHDHWVYEEPSYTDLLEGRILSNGMQKFTARIETINGKNHNPSNTKAGNLLDLFHGTEAFTAKLPTGGLTLPVILGLGSGYVKSSWKDLGEIDYVENMVSDQDLILATVQAPDASFSNGDDSELAATSVFTVSHNY